MRIQHLFYNKIKIADYASVFFSTYGLCLCILLYYGKTFWGISELELDSVLSYNTLCTIFLVVTIYMRYDLNLEADK